MSIVYESRHRAFLPDESYPNIDQADDEVNRYGDADDSNSVMHDVGDVSDLAAAVAVSYHPPEQSILASSKPSLLDDDTSLDVDDVVVGDSTGHDLASSPDMTSAAAAAVASANIAVAEAEAARMARHSSSAGQTLQPASLAPSSPLSMKVASTPSPAPAPITYRVKPIAKHERDVQKNSDGLYHCTWPDCTEEKRQFGRKCEYNKHMDKHERPYRCTADGCEKLPGFTYSGGLLRHEREVHGKHGGPRNPLHCPYQTCKRFSGKGFSRQENLNEHMRRVHLSMSPGSTPAIPLIPSNATAEALLSQANSGLLSMNVIRSLSAVLPNSPPQTGVATGASGVSNSSRNNSTGSSTGNANNNTAAAAAAAAAAVAANAVAGMPSLLSDDHDDVKAMESLGLLMPSRGRKRTASSLIGDDDDVVDADSLVNGAHLGDFHNGHRSSTSHDLREEMKRVRLENEELRRQVELQRRQTLAMMQQISALQRSAAHQQQLNQRQQEQQQRQAQAQQAEQQQAADTASHELDDVLGSETSAAAM